MDKNPFLERLMRIDDDKRGEVFHSSTYGMAQNKAGMGTASTKSFSARIKIDQSRNIIKAYRDSKVVNEVRKGALRTKACTPRDGENSKNVNNVKSVGGARRMDNGRSRSLPLKLPLKNL